MQFDADEQVTPCRTAPTTPGATGLALGTIDHEVPFQFSISVPVGFPLPATPRIAPTAQQAVPPTQATSKKPPPSPAGSGGWAPRLQLDPFQVSNSGVSVPPALMFAMEIPTPMHWMALGQLDPSKMSSAPVPGVVATYHPDVAAPPPVPASTPPAPITTMTREHAMARHASARLP